MNEFGAALQLSRGFSENWSSLEESFTCLDEWFPAHAYVLVVERRKKSLPTNREIKWRRF